MEGGKILEADFAQLSLELAYLSQDKVAINEIKTGFDVHAYTLKLLSASGRVRLARAKAHTFAPLYGATGFGRTKAEANTTKTSQKVQRHRIGIQNWLKALEKRSITTPSGESLVFLM